MQHFLWPILHLGDLSDVMFVTTANTLNILPPLLDRMEVIRLAGYTEDEKINIANKYLLPKQIKENGVKKEEEIKDITPPQGWRLSPYSDGILTQELAKK